MVLKLSFSYLNKWTPNFRRFWLAVFAVLLSAVAVVYGALLLWGAWEPLLSPLVDLERNRRLLRAWQEYFGLWMPAVFVLLQALQVVAAPIPGEATGFLAGYLFGIRDGFLYALTGLVLGSGVDFYLGRRLEKFLLQRVIPRNISEIFGFLRNKQGKLIVFLLFLLPGFPKDFLCYFLGMTPMSFGAFFLTMAAGRAPATWLLVLQGAQLARGDHLVFPALIGAAAILAVSFYAYRNRVSGWMRRKSRPAKPQVA
jgi:uncharacterized membrane protein YdjX (TVP38/TMEM64 family)